MAQAADLEERVQDTHDPSSGSQAPGHGASETHGQENLESKVQSTSSKLWDLTKLAAIGAGVLYYAFPSPLATMAGYVLGTWYMNRKEKKPTTFKDIYKAAYTGLLFGGLGYAMYNFYDWYSAGIKATTFLGKVAKTLLFNPVLFPPFVGAYRVFTYLRDKIGFKNVFTKPHKIFSYLGEVYEKDLKPNFWSNVKKASLTFWLPNYLSLNYFTNNHIRVAIGAANDLIFNIISSGKKKDEHAENPEHDKHGEDHSDSKHHGQKPWYQKAKDYVSNYFTWPADERKKREEEESKKKKEQEEEQKKQQQQGMQQQQIQQLLQQMGQGQGGR
ncbi:hypothetical protein J4206_02235 [Candidatus Woesearchaeota archaeon]|nr:hypothetical protein [Candidatus Woesearchaeota archaeon]